TITADGTETCEWYGGYTEDDYSVCTPYGAGEFEQARNVSQLAGTRVTVLDPRYSPSGGMLKKDYTSLLCPGDDGTGNTVWTNCGYTEAPYPEDVRDPSGFFATFETGDNTVVTVETATVPLDMYYSRASNFGDDWDEQDICAIDPEESWYPNASVVCDVDEVQMRWDWLENGDDLATEASVYGNPNGDRFYAVWNQELPISEDLHANMDSEFRRIFYNLFTDVAPTVTSLFASTDRLSVVEDDTLLLTGTGRDRDRLGDPNILKLMWFDDKGAILCKLDDAAELEECLDKDPQDGLCDNGCIDDNENLICDDKEVDAYECEKETEVKASDMEPGMYKIKLKVMDNEGRWSPVVELSTSIWVAYQFYDTYLPLVTR
ncbi:MAG: hypothetical protein GWN58_07765, partial [Anaerolineae bacterium]|nr:hypothetical protein [Anaerolineae bacterium]